MTEADTLDHLLTPLGAQEEALRGDLQSIHDDLYALLGHFHTGSHRGDRVVRTAVLDEGRLYDLYDRLKELRQKHGLSDRG